MTGETSKEVWKDIPGYEGKYQASDLGRIRSLDRRVRVVPHGIETTRLIKGRILKPGKYCKSNHVSVVLGHDQIGQPVHKLVMLAFVGPCPKGKEVLHGNGDPTDNRLTNLRYGTRSENILDVYRIGKRWRKLNVNEAIEIRRLYDQKVNRKEIAKQFGISISQVYAIGRRIQYEWLN